MSSLDQQKQQRNQQQQQQGGVDELANRLNQMNVYSQQTSNTNNNNNNNLMDGRQQQQIYCGNNNPYRLAGSDLTNIQQNYQDIHQEDENMDTDNNATLFVAQENQEQEQHEQQQQHQQQQQQSNNQNNQNKTGNILIVTNVDSSVFSDKLTQTKFESLFLAHDNQVTFRYLKSFRRVRLDFTDSYRAEEARKSLSTFKIGDTICKCFMAQMITPQFQSQQQQQQLDNNATTVTNYGNNLNECYHLSTNHLNIPKLTKQFLISPPASPPVGWEPVHEGSPCIDVQLLSAMANLVPGKVHEIHQGNESQPGIYVEVCEDPQFPNSQIGGGGAATKRCHIPKTPSPLKQSF